MKLLLLGATGRTGRLVIDAALAKYHEVVALARDPSKVTAMSPRLTVLAGTPERSGDVARAITGCEAVVVALNNNRTSDMPWARPVSPPHLIETSVRNAVAAMKVTGIRRLVVLSATGAGDSFADAPVMIRFLIKRTNLGHTYADHDRTDSFVHELDWTLVRAVGLSNAEKLKALIVSYGGNPKPAMMISRKHVAKFMVDILDDPRLFGRAPVISER